MASNHYFRVQVSRHLFNNMSWLLKIFVVLGLLCPQVRGADGCFPVEITKTLAKKPDPVDRFLLLSKIGEQQAAVFVDGEDFNSIIFGQGPPLRKRPRPTTGEILDLNDCAWSQLLDELWHWKPHRSRDKDAIREMLRRANHAENMLKERQPSVPTEPSASDLRIHSSLVGVREVEERLLALIKYK